MTISFAFLHESGCIEIAYGYKHNSGKLVQSVSILGDKRLTEFGEIDEYVKERKINLSLYFSKSEELLRNKVIPDWLQVYPSSFAKDNWGDVKIIYYVRNNLQKA